MTGRTVTAGHPHDRPRRYRRTPTWPAAPLPPDTAEPGEDAHDHVHRSPPPSPPPSDAAEPAPRRRRRVGRLVVAGLLAGLLGIVAGFALVVSPDATEEAEAHGSVSRPASRTYSCRFEQPDNQMCAAAWSADSQALYDWMEVNIGDVDGQHQARIPDGELCGAGRDKYAAFDQPGTP
jgi:chitin binding protein